MDHTSGNGSAFSDQIRKKRKQAILNRWFDIFLYTAIGLVFFVFIEHRDFKIKSDLRGARGYIIALITVSFFVYFVKFIVECFIYKDRKKIIKNYLLPVKIRLFLFHYPSCFLASLMACFLYLCYFYWKEDSLACFLSFSMIVLFLYVIFMMCFLYENKPEKIKEDKPIERQKYFMMCFLCKNRPEKKENDPNPVKTKIEDILKWIKEDKPIERQEDDYFDFTVQAHKIAGRMLHTPIPSQVLIGPLGSGKTTMGKLVRQRLEEQGSLTPEGFRVRLVMVELWPYENPKAAVEGILKQFLDGMGRDVDTLALRGIPERYGNAIRSADSWWTSLMQLLCLRNDPVHTLQAINETALAVGIRYVVWLDEMERFAPKEADQEERLQPVRALLHGMNHLEAVSVIVATTHLGANVNLSKIARYINPMPEMEISLAQDVVEKVKPYLATFSS